MVQLTISPIEIKDGAINFESWLQNLQNKYTIENLNLLRQAGALALVAGAEHATPNGESCLHQGLLMAEMLAELHMDSETLAAALVYSSVRYADLKLEDVTEHLGEKITKLITGTLQMDAINTLNRDHYHAHETTSIDNIRKMLLAMVDDVSVVLIKLVERLCILRNVAIFNDARKKQVAKETMDIYAPLANRLGIGQIKWQLEDLSFRYLESEYYKKISSALNERRVDREQYIQDVISDLTHLLEEADIKNFKITGRAKHIYSIYRKMNRKKVDFNEIYDINAIRILVPSVEDCYAALSSVHTRWQHITREFDDYIAKPKANGYQSIHTAVIGPQNKTVEIQIRTFNMHELAELGVAAHWVYKEGIHKPSSYQEKIAWLRQVLDWQKEVAKTEEAKADIQAQLFDDRVYVFTPNGAVLDLPKGATPLDFAYQIHSELGHRCRGAKVNGHIVPLSYQLNTGEQIEILTIKRGQPSRDWLNPHLGYVNTTRAKAKILQWFRKQDYDKNLADGQALIEKEFKRLNLKNIDLEPIAHKLNYKNTHDLLAGLGRNDLGLNVITHALHIAPEPSITPEIKTEISKPKSAGTLTDIDVSGVGNLLTHMALCCKPVPGDEIIGYVTRGRGISIHRKDCINIQRAEHEHDEKIVAVSWGSKIDKRYAVDLMIHANNRNDLVRDITNILTQDNIPLLSLNCVYNKNENTVNISLTVEISSLAPLSKILTRIQQLPDIFSVKRAS